MDHQFIFFILFPRSKEIGSSQKNALFQISVRPYKANSAVNVEAWTMIKSD